jgi:O-antigen ligase
MNDPTKPPPTKTQEILGLEEVPRWKWRKMLHKTFVGALFVTLAAFGGGRWGWPWYAVLGAGVLGATVWAGQVVLSPFKLLTAALRDVMAAVNNAPPPPNGPSEGGQP